tara:strand:+ start:22767 stop:23354 length:588 start_codon:yes stop_codon:yes gene_type:complete
MKSTELLNQIRGVLGMELSEDVKLAVMKLENGTEIEADQFSEGAKVFIKNEDSDSIPLPVGEYTLESGEKLKVEEEGVIASMEKVEAESVEAENVEAEEEKEEKEMKEHYATKEELAEIKKDIDDIKKMVSAMDHKNKEKEDKKEMSEDVSEVEMSAEEVKPISHAPEKLASQKFGGYSSSNSQLDLIRSIIYNK